MDTSSKCFGQIMDFGDNILGRWYQATLERVHAYRNAIDRPIGNGS